MAIFPAVAGSVLPQYQVPQGPQAKIDDERIESMAVKAMETHTGKDSAVSAKSANKVDIKA